MTQSKAVTSYLEPQEVMELEEAAEYLRDKLLIRLLFHLGYRISEALGIRASVDKGKGFGEGFGSTF